MAKLTRSGTLDAGGATLGGTPPQTGLYAPVFPAVTDRPARTLEVYSEFGGQGVTDKASGQRQSIGSWIRENSAGRVIAD